MTATKPPHATPAAPRVVVRQDPVGRHGTARKAEQAFHLGFEPLAAGPEVVMGWDGPRAVRLDLSGTTRAWRDAFLGAFLEAAWHATARQEEAAS